MAADWDDRAVCTLPFKHSVHHILVMAYIVMACVAMAYIAMAYVVMANILPPPQNSRP